MSNVKDDPKEKNIDLTGIGEGTKNRGLSSLRNRNRKLDTSTAPTKSRSREPAYSHSIIQNKIDIQRVRKSGRQKVRRLWWMVLEVETGREVGRKGQNHLVRTSSSSRCWEGSKEEDYGLLSYMYCCMPVIIIINWDYQTLPHVRCLSSGHICGMAYNTP